MSNETTEEILVRLDCEGKLCLLEIAAHTTAFRVQKTGHQHAHRFGCPDEPGRLGRFNDPCMQYGVWYGAQYPAGALAETFGRLKPVGQRGIGIVLNAKDLEGYDMCLVAATRNTRLLDLKACLSKLGRTVDEVTGPDYALTQEMVRVLCRLGPGRYDGIAYESRHHPQGACYALWVMPGGAAVVKTLKMTNCAEFGSRDEGSDSVMDVEEMLTEILGYRVI